MKGEPGTNDSAVEELKEAVPQADKPADEEAKAGASTPDPTAEEAEQTVEPEATEPDKDAETPEEKAERLARENEELRGKLSVTEANRIALQKNLESTRSAGPTVDQLLAEVGAMKRQGAESQALLLDAIDALASGRVGVMGAPAGGDIGDFGVPKFKEISGGGPAGQTSDVGAAAPPSDVQPFPTPHLDKLRGEWEQGQAQQRTEAQAVATVQTMLDLAGMPVDSPELNEARQALMNHKPEEAIDIAKNAIIAYTKVKRSSQEEELEQRAQLLALKYLGAAGIGKQDTGGPTAAPSDLEGKTPTELAEKAYSRSK